MSVSSGKNINAYEFNLLQQRVQNLLGNGFGDLGYGQTVTSTPVKPPSDPNSKDSDDITADQFNRLLSDIGRIFKHQTGSDLPIPDFNTSNIVGADASGQSVTISSDNSVTIDPQTREPLQGFNNIENTVDQLESEQNRFEVAGTQVSLDLLFSDERETEFNGTVSSTFRLSFSSNDARRHFFNAGGQIIIQGSVTNLQSPGDVSYDRNQGWNGLINNPGSIVFGYNYVDLPSENTNGVTLASNTGNYQLTSQYQVIFKKEGGSGVYSNSFWQIEAKNRDDQSIDFRISLTDAGPESNIDAGDPGSVPGGVREPVTANINFDIEGRKADDAVRTEYPAYQILNSFED